MILDVVVVVVLFLTFQAQLLVPLVPSFFEI
jgi:hypothetical protein